ncbi:MAG: hypothetical protein ACR2QW_17785 [bacterium]
MNEVIEFFKPRKSVRVTLKIIAVLALTSLAGSCATVRKATYPPDFVYLEKQEVSSAMQKMAVSIGQLHRLLSDTAYQPASKKDDVLAELDKIETITRSLDTGGIQSNHPLIDQHMNGFRGQVLIARNAVQQDQPDYYPAGRLVGQCHGCHIQK